MSETEREIRSFFETEAESVSLAPGIHLRVLRASKRRRLLTAATAGIVALAIVVGGIVTVGALDFPSGRRIAGPRPPAGRLARGEIVRIPVADLPQPIAADNSGAWVVTGTGETTNVLWHIDARTNHAIKLARTRGAMWPAVGEGFAWVTCSGSANPCAGNSVLKLDARTGTILATIPLPGPTNWITTGLGSVWVSTQAGLVKIDPDTARVVATFAIKTDHLATAGDSLWATGVAGDLRDVAKIDPSNGNILKKVAFADPCEMLATDQAVWVSSCMSSGGQRGDQLLRIDPTSGRILYRVPVRWGGSLAFAAHRLWLPVWAQDHFEIAAHDPKTGKATGTVLKVKPSPVPPGSYQGFGIGPPGLFSAVGDGSFWLTHIDATDVVRMGIGHG
jgi:hypothetical protein